MVSNVTTEIINYANQVNAEQNIKILLILSAIVVALVLFYFDTRKLKGAKRASFILLKLYMKIFYFPIFIFFPLSFYLLSLTESVANFMTVYLFNFYLMIMVAAMLFLAIFLFEEIMLMVGWEITLEGIKINTVKMEGDKNA